jgi:Gluconate 2-dehydrogenase subunit 3
MPIWLSEDEMTKLRRVVDRLIPAGDGPGALEAGAAEYIDGFLGAFMFDPPRIWAGGPTSDRFGGRDGYSEFHRLSAIDELSWRTRLEGSLGIPEREFNGPVVGLQEIYREGLARLGADFISCEPEECDRRLRAEREFLGIVFPHVCEGTYGAPEYGGNRGLCGWASIDFAGDVQPRGWTDAEVSEP